MFNYKTSRQLNVLNHKLGKALVTLFAILAGVLLLIIVIKGLPNNHPSAALGYLADLLDFDGSLTYALKSNPAILISVTALIMSSASIINALNAKPSFNVRDVAAANRFADWGRRWVFRCDRSAKAAVKKAESFRLGGDFDDYQSAIELALLVTSEISMHLGDGRSIGSDFRYLEARPLFDTETMDAFLAAVSKTKEFADLYRELAPIEVVNHIDRVGLLEDIQSIANVTARLGDHMRRFSNGKWKDQVAH